MRRTPALIATAAVLSAGLVALPQSAPAAPVASSSVTPDAAPKPKPKYRATIRFTKYGTPHIKAENFGSLGFGSGYAAAEASICTLADTLLTARGERSRFLGPKGRYQDQVTLDASHLQVDAFVTDLHNRKVVEKLLRSKAGPGAEAKAMVKGYVAGINKWVRTNRITDPACRNAKYIKPNATTLDLWYGVYMANLLASAGVFIKEIVDADPPSLTDPGLPEIPLRQQVDTKAEREALLKALGRDPQSAFGSNATAVGGAVTKTKRGILLGNPHFPWRGRYRFTQQHLTIPGKYDVAGASLIGSPVVNIGWNKNVAWSHTVSTAYRFTPYEYKTLGPMTYLTDSGPKRLERRTVKVKVKQGGRIVTRTEDLFRTPQGYVVDSPATLMPWGPISVWAIRDANAEHLRTIDTFLNMGKANGVRDLLKRQDRGGGMPWVNTTAAGRNGKVLYADHSVVPHVTNAKKNQCLTPSGILLDTVAGLPGLDGTFAGLRCAWGADADAQRPGILGPAKLPNAFSRKWLMNANDSYWLPHPDIRLEGFPTIIGCERCERTMRTKMVMQYVIDRLAKKGVKGLETPHTMRSHQYANRLRAAEVMRAGGALDRVCAQTGETKACAVLRKWDGRSNPGSRGTHIFEEFLKRVPAQGLWTTPFSADDPLNTPRGLNSANPQVVQAMAGAIAFLRQRKIPFNATWGSLQVAGDRGAPPLPLGGGEGDNAGNANALASRMPQTNRGKFKPITYGSSHIQAIAYHDKGRVEAKTILTYGQVEDPNSPHSKDQTKLFSQEKWVRFPFSSRDVRRATVRKVTVSGS